MRILNEQAMRQAVDCQMLMQAIEEGFRVFASGQCQMADRFTVKWEDNLVMYMPCQMQEAVGTKILAEIPSNPARGLPYLDGLMILQDGETGKPLAILNGSVLTALRTGAVGGVAMKYFAHPGSRSLGLVGCGTQGLHQLFFGCMTQEIQDLYLYDAYKKDLSAFVSQLKSMIAPRQVSIHICGDTRELLEKSQIVVTATQATSPVFPEEPELFRGKCLIAFGSWKPNMREIPSAVFQVADTVYTELPFACEESGDLSQPLSEGILRKEQVRYLGDALLGREPFSLGETRYYKSVGMGIFDLMAARMLWKIASSRNLGVEVAF